MKYYDKILIGIMASVFMGVVMGILTSVPLSSAVAMGGVVSIGFMYHGMFKNAPITQNPSQFE